MKFPPETEIKRLRKSLDITQSELARLSGVSQSTIAKLERGSIKGSYEAVTKIFFTLQNESRKLTKASNAMDLATRQIVGVQSTEQVKAAIELMRSSGISQMPVFQGRQHVGSISEMQILTRLRDGERMETIVEMRVSEVMDEAFPIVNENTPIEAVTALLSSSHAVMVSKQGDMSGIITSADLLKLL
ncbi:MAG: CBS domain-containing protein [Methanomassiliicoccales archaeon]|nr:CBS domain-containing protein [Methanomassiliicoccales archaeon]